MPLLRCPVLYTKTEFRQSTKQFDDKDPGKHATSQERATGCGTRFPRGGTATTAPSGSEWRPSPASGTKHWRRRRSCSCWRAGSSPRAKIGDFGTSKWVQHTNSTGLATYTTSDGQGAKMSLAWAAPEVLDTTGNSYASDVYSFGIVTWEVITRQLPWADQPLARDIFLRVVMKGERPVIPPDCPPDIAQVIRACWAELPADRPTFDGLVKGMKSVG